MMHSIERSKRCFSEMDDFDECDPVPKRVNGYKIAERVTQNLPGHPQCSTDTASANDAAPNSADHTLASNGAYVTHPGDQTMATSASALPQNGLGSSHPQCNSCHDVTDCQVSQLSFITALGSEVFQPQPMDSVDNNVERTGWGPRLMHGLPADPDVAMAADDYPQFYQRRPEHDMYPGLTSPSASSQDSDMNYIQYSPELDEQENPYYYHINQVLFDAHRERLRRDGSPSYF